MRTRNVCHTRIEGFWNSLYLFIKNLKYASKKESMGLKLYFFLLLLMYFYKLNYEKKAKNIIVIRTKLNSQWTFGGKLIENITRFIT